MRELLNPLFLIFFYLLIGAMFYRVGKFAGFGDGCDGGLFVFFSRVAYIFVADKFNRL